MFGSIFGIANFELGANSFIKLLAIESSGLPKNTAFPAILVYNEYVYDPSASVIVLTGVYKTM